MGNSTIESLKNKVHYEDEASHKQRVVYKKNAVLMSCKRPRRIMMKRRRVRLEGSRRTTGGGGSGGIERRVRTLKGLVPNSRACTGLDGLFSETADYILSLQMKVKLMQIMVKALTNSDE